MVVEKGVAREALRRAYRDSMGLKPDAKVSDKMVSDFLKIGSSTLSDHLKGGMRKELLDAHLRKFEVTPPRRDFMKAPEKAPEKASEKAPPAPMLEWGPPSRQDRFALDASGAQRRGSVLHHSRRICPQSTGCVKIRFCVGPSCAVWEESQLHGLEGYCGLVQTDSGMRPVMERDAMSSYSEEEE